MIQKDEKNISEMLKKRSHDEMEDQKSTGSEDAWEDPDDEKVTVDLSNKARLRKIMRQNNTEETVTGKDFTVLLRKYHKKKFDGFNFLKWTDNDYQDTELEDLNADKGGRLAKMLKTQNLLLSEEKREAMPKNYLSVEKISQIDHKDKLKSVVQAIDIHPENDEKILIGGFDKHVKLFDIKRDDENDSFYFDNLKSFFFEKFPIKCAKFYNQKSEQIVMSSIKKHILFFDIEKQKSDILSNVFFHKKLSYKKNCIEKFELSSSQKFLGFYNEKNNGLLGIVNPKNKQLIFDLKINENCTDLKFLGDFELLVSGDKGNLYLWDLRMRRIVNRFKDHGAVKVTAIDSRNEKLAVASNSGIVNVYDFGSEEKAQRGDDGKGFLPYKRYDNLTTEITKVKFDKFAKRLVFSSKWIKGALRVANCLENCVYHNWPNFNSKFSLISTFNFSDNGDKLYIGEESGHVKAFRFD